VLFFADKITIPLIRQENKKSILEIGSSYGNSIRPLLELGDINVSVIDPCIDADLFREFGQRITLHKGLSLDILPQLEGSFDCIFIDGDHNWYTVFNELKLIEERRLLKEDGIIFLHDVGWPYGRRDMYYQPETIPVEYRNPYDTRGMQKGKPRLLDEGGFNAGHYNAIVESGDKNGVLTAVEDFLMQTHQQFYFVDDPREFGFGILLRKSRRNNWRRARKLRLRILRQIWLDPHIQTLRDNFYRLRSSRTANFARRIRNSLR
jgi:SAM-dependent methyltransferase